MIAQYVWPGYIYRSRAPPGQANITLRKISALHLCLCRLSLLPLCAFLPRFHSSLVGATWNGSRRDLMGNILWGQSKTKQNQKTLKYVRICMCESSVCACAYNFPVCVCMCVCSIQRKPLSCSHTEYDSERSRAKCHGTVSFMHGNDCIHVATIA